MSDYSTRLIKYTVVDAFTDKIFGGNPAAIIVLPEDIAGSATPELDDRTLQLIAREFNLSETAFITPRSSSNTIPLFGLRWFTPKGEVSFCGHATLASAHTLFSTSQAIPADASLIHFETLSGTLTARKTEGRKIELEFPAGIPERAKLALEEKTRRAVGNAINAEHNVVFVGVGRGVSFHNYMLIELEMPFDLEKAVVNPGALLDLAPDHVVITLTTTASTNSVPGTHFLSRTFGPHAGIPEDPVTGSAHCMLAPYWHQKLQIQHSEVMHARQVSERGGTLDVVWDQEKGTCRLLGQATTAAKGELLLPV